MFYAMCFFLGMIEVVFSIGGFFQQQVTEGRKWPVAFQLQMNRLVRFAGFPMILRVNPQVISYHSIQIVFRGFQMEVF